LRIGIHCHQDFRNDVAHEMPKKFFNLYIFIHIYSTVHIFTNSTGSTTLQVRQGYVFAPLTLFEQGRKGQKSFIYQKNSLQQRIRH
jgi:hypothetical protein